MKKRVVIVILLLAFGAIAVWELSGLSAPSERVHDVCQAETLVLGQETGDLHTYGISIHGSGYIDGDATISLLLNGQPYKVEKLSGRFNFEWRAEWYAETASVRYEPAGVRSGKVVLYYEFQ